MPEEKENRIEEVVNLIGMLRALQDDLESIDSDRIQSINVENLQDHILDLLCDLEEELDLLEAKDDDDFIDPAGGRGLHSHI